MKSKIILVFIVFILLTGCSVENEYISQKRLSCLFINNELYQRSILQPKIYEGKNIIAGVVPHHIVASSLISGFFNMVKNEDFDTVVILAPNHFVKEGDIMSSQLGWSVNSGILENDNEILKKLMDLNKFDIVLNDTYIENDHSASNLIPYIQYYQSNVKVLPLLLSSKTSLEMTDDLANFLYEISKTKKMLLVCSVDFSHYLTVKEAKIKDIETKEAMLNFDYKKIYNFTDNNMDCPSAIITYLKYTKLCGADKVNILANADASVFSTDLSNGTTSYFVLAT